MKIWVKEFENILLIDMVSIWVKKDISVLVLKDFSYVSRHDVVIVTRHDTTIKKEDYYKYNMVEYEECFQIMTTGIFNELKYDYDYYYIKNALYRAKNLKIDTLITGSSYGLFDIDNDIAFFGGGGELIYHCHPRICTIR